MRRRSSAMTTSSQSLLVFLAMWMSRRKTKRLMRRPRPYDAPMTTAVQIAASRYGHGVSRKTMEGYFTSHYSSPVLDPTGTEPNNPSYETAESTAEDHPRLRI